MVPLGLTAFEPVDDMVTLDSLDEPSILFNIRKRFASEKIYTYVGGTLVAINPYKQVPSLYSQPIIDKFLRVNNLNDIQSMIPHVYGIAQRAYTLMKRQNQRQSVLIGGESGAGKTESARILLQFLCQASTLDLTGSKKANVLRSTTTHRIEDQIVEANTILEAFGNAKTARNDNSSRFGKFIQLDFDRNASIVGATIINYLLEKSRIVSLAQGERSYHVFYQLCNGANKVLREKVKVGDAKSYRYLNQSQSLTIPNVRRKK